MWYSDLCQESPRIPAGILRLQVKSLVISYQQTSSLKEGTHQAEVDQGT